jgi:hypothetical protein
LAEFVLPFLASKPSTNVPVRRNSKGQATPSKPRIRFVVAISPSSHHQMREKLTAKSQKPHIRLLHVPANECALDGDCQHPQ